MRSAVAFSVAIGLFAAAPASGGGKSIYRYVEQDGTIVYTNVPPGGKAGRQVRRMEGEFHPAPPKARSARKAAATNGAALTDYDGYIELAAKRYRVPANLVRAVVHAESGFDPMAVSPKGASGLMQLMPQTASEMYVKDIFDPRDNIEGGTRYLRLLANEFGGDMVKMVAAYNAGPEAVHKYGDTVPPYDETQTYVRKVIDLYFQYKAKSQLAQNEPR